MARYVVLFEQAIYRKTDGTPSKLTRFPKMFRHRGNGFRGDGSLGLVYPASTPFAIVILAIQEVWLPAAAITLAARRV